jgi:hypothetical protein
MVEKPGFSKELSLPNGFPSQTVDTGFAQAAEDLDEYSPVSLVPVLADQGQKVRSRKRLLTGKLMLSIALRLVEMCP